MVCGASDTPTLDGVVFGLMLPGELEIDMDLDLLLLLGWEMVDLGSFAMLCSL